MFQREKRKGSRCKLLQRSIFLIFIHKSTLFLLFVANTSAKMSVNVLFALLTAYPHLLRLSSWSTCFTLIHFVSNPHIMADIIEIEPGSNSTNPAYFIAKVSCCCCYCSFDNHWAGSRETKGEGEEKLAGLVARGEHLLRLIQTTKFNRQQILTISKKFLVLTTLINNMLS